MSAGKPNRFDFQTLEARKRVARFGRVILVGSGKGGVGKSLVACAITLLLAKRGFRTGILDIDIHGASVPNYLGVNPPLRSTRNGLEPKVTKGAKVMSVALLTGDNPVPMRGPDKRDLITQFLALTDWGRLDFLIVDLPPSTGDEMLSAFDLFAGKARLVLVTTPSRNAIGVVSRLRRLAASERVPVDGIVLNMAYAESEGRRTFPFGRITHDTLEKLLESTIVAEIPLEPRVNYEALSRVLQGRNSTAIAFKKLVDRWTSKGSS